MLCIFKIDLTSQVRRCWRRLRMLKHPLNPLRTFKLCLENASYHLITRMLKFTILLWVRVNSSNSLLSISTLGCFYQDCSKVTLCIFIIILTSQVIRCWRRLRMLKHPPNPLRSFKLCLENASYHLLTGLLNYPMLLWVRVNSSNSLLSSSTLDSN